VSCVIRPLGESERTLWLTGDAAGLYAALARGGPGRAAAFDHAA
jgi:hypothetical protein